MLYQGFDGDIIYKSASRNIVIDRISPQILMDRMEHAGYSHKFAMLSVTGKINLSDRTATIALGKELGLLR